jgi:hypothetical protein
MLLAFIELKGNFCRVECSDCLTHVILLSLESWNLALSPSRGACKDFDFFNSRRSGQQFAGSPFQCLRNLAAQVGTAAGFVCKGIASDEKGTSKWYAIKLGSGRFGIVASGWADPKNT